MVNIGDRLRIFAKYIGTSKRLAEMLGMTPQSLNFYLKGKREPGANILKRLLDLGLNINWLLTGEGEMLTYSESNHGVNSSELMNKIRSLEKECQGKDVIINSLIDEIIKLKGGMKGNVKDVKKFAKNIAKYGEEEIKKVTE